MYSIMSTLVHLNGTDFYYEAAGSGPPLILLHAGIADSRMWDAQVPALAEAFTVIRYDLRGFGRTPPVPGPFAHHDDLRALLDHLGVARAALLGCSQGSRVALDFALTQPARVERLVLSSPAIGGFRYDGPPPSQAAELEAADAAGDLARVNELELQVWVDGPHRAPQQVDGRVRELARAMNAIALANEGVGEEQPLEPPAAGRLGEIGAPALLIVGELDAARTLAQAARLEAALPHARRANIPGAAHLPNMERPEVFNRLVMSFLLEDVEA